MDFNYKKLFNVYYLKKTISTLKPSFPLQEMVGFTKNLFV